MGWPVAWGPISQVGQEERGSDQNSEAASSHPRVCSAPSFTASFCGPIPGGAGCAILQNLHTSDVVIARKLSQICVSLLTLHLLPALILSASCGNEGVR